MCIYDDQINQKQSSSKHRYSKQIFKKCVYLVFKFDWLSYPCLLKSKIYSWMWWKFQNSILKQVFMNIFFNFWRLTYLKVVISKYICLKNCKLRLIEK